MFASCEGEDTYPQTPEEVPVFASCVGEDKGEARIGELRYAMKQRCC